MDLLRTAVVDITTLVAACHALMAAPLEVGLGVHRKLRGRLRRDIKRATVAYIDTLSRTKRGLVDSTLLSKCRMTAEQEMRHAIRKRPAIPS